MKCDVNLLARILEHIPGSIIVTDTAGAINYMNASSVKRLGFSPEELESSSIEALIWDVEKGDCWKHIQAQVLGTGGAFRGELQLICKDNKTILCSANGFCVCNNSGEPEDIVLVFQDISKERKGAEEIEKKNLEISKMNSDLLRSNRELRRVNELKTKFLSIASHELKTPLTSIKGYAEIILDNMREKIDKDVLSMIESIDRAANRLHNVINNMLDVTRIEQKRLRLKPEHVNLQEVVEEGIKELSQFTLRRRISIVTSFEANLPTLYCDKMRMHQVFTNLFSNAIKFSPDYTSVEVRIFLEEENGGRFHIIVADQGIGIDQDELQKIFDPFYEVASTSRHSSDSIKFMGGGTGLGLSIVRGIVERHGGIVWAESPGTKQGEFPGSMFHMLFPVKTQIKWDDDETKSIKVAQIMATTQPKVKTPAPSSIKPLILIIDDDKEAMEISRMILQNSFDLRMAENGEEGVRIAFTEKPSLILLDTYMPGLDGYIICRILKTMDETKDIPVAFFSAATQDEEIEKCFASGGDDFIIKPFSSKEMIEKVNRLLGLEQPKK